jgi:hypothetical protein
MAKPRDWLQASHRLLMLFFLVVFLPAVTLVFLGVRLLEQDRALERQREGEILERAADNGVRVLEQDLAELAKHLSGPVWAAAEIPEGCLYIHVAADRIQAAPPGRLPYYPTAGSLKEIPQEPFLDRKSVV